MCWARVKYCCHSNHTLLGMQTAIPSAFSANNISLDVVQKWFRKGRDYMTVTSKVRLDRVGCGEDGVMNQGTPFSP